MTLITLSAATTPLDLIISAQGLVRTHPQFARWILSSNLPKQTLTLRHALDPKASCTAKVRGPKLELAASPAAAGILKPLISFLIGNGLASSGEHGPYDLYNASAHPLGRRAFRSLSKLLVLSSELN